MDFSDSNKSVKRKMVLFIKLVLLLELYILKKKKTERA